MGWSRLEWVGAQFDKAHKLEYFAMSHYMYHFLNFRSRRTKKEKEKGMLFNLDS